MKEIVEQLNQKIQNLLPRLGSKLISGIPEVRNG